MSATTRGRTIIPDGTVRDSNYLPRGYWEAKDTADDLDAEIRTKIERGYPTKVNPSLTLRGIPEKCFDYRLGNRSALDWVINQYQVTEHKRSGIKSDPNREDDPEYIVRLAGQVIRVSLETVRIVESLPKEYS